MLSYFFIECGVFLTHGGVLAVGWRWQGRLDCGCGMTRMLPAPIDNLPVAASLIFVGFKVVKALEGSGELLVVI